MKYIHTETGEVWTGQPSTSRTSNFYLLSDAEKVSLGWTFVADAVPTIDEKKQYLLAKINSEASKHIYENYPLHKQVNASLGIYGDEYLNTMISFINATRTKVDEYKALVANGNLEFEVVF